MSIEDIYLSIFFNFNHSLEFFVKSNQNTLFFFKKKKKIIKIFKDEEHEYFANSIKF